MESNSSLQREGGCAASISGWLFAIFTVVAIIIVLASIFSDGEEEDDHED